MIYCVLPKDLFKTTLKLFLTEHLEVDRVSWGILNAHRRNRRFTLDTSEDTVTASYSSENKPGFEKWYQQNIKEIL